MSSRDEDYVLGEDVTSLAKSKAKHGTVVLSVRLSVDEVAELEAVSDATRKTLSQVVREALKEYLQVAARRAYPVVTVSFDNGYSAATFTTGTPEHSGRAQLALNEHAELAYVR